MFQIAEIYSALLSDPFLLNTKLTEPVAILHGVCGGQLQRKRPRLCLGKFSLSTLHLELLGFLG